MHLIISNMFLMFLIYWASNQVLLFF